MAAQPLEQRIQRLGQAGARVRSEAGDLPTSFFSAPALRSRAAASVADATRVSAVTASTSGCVCSAAIGAGVRGASSACNSTPASSGQRARRIGIRFRAHLVIASGIAAETLEQRFDIP
jgi:hypothetical protein